MKLALIIFIACALVSLIVLFVSDDPMDSHQLLYRTVYFSAKSRKYH
ncbi:MAG: hypothetical protein ACLSE4_09710 [Clostridium sp.]